MSKEQPRQRRCELLAPAGGVEAGLAALQYGADAVYLGLKRFSARADADNFTLAELDSLVAHAHALSPRRKIFVTLNTLVLQAELPALVEALGALSDIGVDAIIVQDLGVARLAREHFPELALHASTQLAVHDRAGMETSRRLGFERVTLARELTLEEIRDCAQVKDIEVETFLHGALCYSYSGLCLLSSHAVGRSGNRGRCAYPCRDRWRVDTTAAPMSESAKSGFAFSMKDLSLADHVPALRDAGVACLKIEGRKKSPLYVATTVDFYRRVLDGTLVGAERAAREADLKAVFSRPWTSLYLRSHRDKDVADRDFVGHRGAPIGVVESVVKSGEVVSVRLTSARALARHDGLQIDIPGIGRPFGFGVSELRLVPASKREKSSSVIETPAGARVDVALPEGYPTIPEGATVYCSSSQDVKLRYRVDPVNLKAMRTRLAVDVEANLEADSLKMKARVPSRGVEAELSIGGAFARAKDAAKTEAAVLGAFHKLGDTRFELGHWRFENPDGLFVPVSKFNEARRLLVEVLEARVKVQVQGRIAKAEENEKAALLDGPHPDPLPPSLRSGGEGDPERHAEAPRRARTSSNEARELSRVIESSRYDRPLPRSGAEVGEGGVRALWSLKVDRFSSLAALSEADWSLLEEVTVEIAHDPLDGLVEKAKRVAQKVPLRLSLPMISRQWEDKALRAKVERLRASGFNRWEAANVSAFSILGTDVDLTADWPLYVLNSSAAQQLFDLGARRVVLSPEDGLANMRALLGALGERATVVVYQDTPLFVSESCPYANLLGSCPGPGKCRFETMDLASSYGGKVLAINERCRTFVVNDKPFCLADRLDVLEEAGARHLRADFVHRPYAPEQIPTILSRLRAGEPLGHRANFERGLAAE